MRKTAVGICLWAVTACGGGTKTQDAGPPPVAERVRTLPERPGAHCVAGGVAVQTGPDTNANGTLDDDEVTLTDYVCNGQVGPVRPSALVRLDAEQPGAHCTQGGTAINAGLDANGDGALQDAEITSTRYVCAAADGHAALTRLDPEPQGAHCEFGGTRVQAGADANRDGMLQDSEVTSTAYVCDGVPAGGTGNVLAGSLTLQNSADVALAARYRIITGDVAVVGALGLEELPLPILETVGGNLTITGNAQLRTLALPALKDVVGDFSLMGNTALSDVTGPAQAFGVGGALMLEGHPLLPDIAFLANLRNVGGVFAVVNMGALTSVGPMELLAAAGGGLLITDNPSLAHVAGFPSLRGVGSDFRVDRNGVLQDVTGFSVLESLQGHLQVTANPMLAQLPAFAMLPSAVAVDIASNPSLAAVTLPGLLTVLDFTVSGNSQLTSLDLGLTQATGNFRVSGNAQLTSLHATALVDVGGTFTVSNNPQLPSCVATGLVAQLNPPGPSLVDVTNNGPGTCP